MKPTIIVGILLFFADATSFFHRLKICHDFFYQYGYNYAVTITLEGFF